MAIVASSSNVRASLRQQISQQPRTSFATGSTSSSLFRSEEDAIIVELGSRWLHAGFEGESSPACTVGFGPQQSRRAGDYRDWLRGNLSDDALSQLRTVARDAEDWVREHELWRMALRDVDLGLVEDKIERAFRDAYNKYLLTNAGTARLALVLPSLVPHPLLSSILSTLFSRWRIPSITLLPSPTMSAVAAGLRSALVVDLGWAETTATGVYEYREISSRRSTRAMKAVQQEMGKFLSSLAISSSGNSTPDAITVPFRYCEEVVNRFAWCRQFGNSSHEEYALSQKIVSVPSPSNPNSNYLGLPFSKFADPVESVIFARGLEACELDDDEESTPLLIYNTLLALPPDARGTCMSRIVFVGGGSRIPGLRRRILQEVSALFEKYGWSHTRGKVIELEFERQRLQDLNISQSRANMGPQPHKDTETQSAKEDIDYVEQKLRRYHNKEKNVPYVHGIFREVDSLGPWAGASLMVSLKTRGLVEIEREKYIQHGLAGASRDSESHPHAADRRSGLRSGGDRTSWTLGGWS